MSANKLSIDDIFPEEANPVEEPDEATQKGLSHMSRDDYESRLRRYHLYQLVSEFQDRKNYTRFALCFVLAWLILVLMLICLNGIQYSVFGFAKVALEIPEKVMVTLIGSTTLNVLGLLWIAFKFMFRHNAGNVIPLLHTSMLRSESKMQQS